MSSRSGWPLPRKYAAEPKPRAAPHQAPKLQKKPAEASGIQRRVAHSRLGTRDARALINFADSNLPAHALAFARTSVPLRAFLFALRRGMLETSRCSSRQLAFSSSTC